MDIAAQSIDSAIVAGSAQLAEHNFGDHLRGRLSPSMILVGAHALATGTVDNLVLAIEGGACQAPNQERDGNGVWIRGGRRVPRNCKLIVLAGPGSAASGR